MIVIVSTARSGTAYTAELLRVHGIEVGHERLKPDGIVSWMWAVEAFDVPYGDSKYTETPIDYYHLVRNPIDTISSCQTLSKESWEFIARYIRLSDNLILNCMLYWYYWNLFCEAISIKRFNVQDPAGILKTFSKQYGIEVRQLNSRQHTDLSWDTLYNVSKELTLKIKKMSNEYGFD